MTNSYEHLTMPFNPLNYENMNQILCERNCHKFKQFTLEIKLNHFITFLKSPKTAAFGR